MLLNKKLIELYGEKNSKFNLLVFVANKLSMITVFALGMSILLVINYKIEFVVIMILIIVVLLIGYEYQLLSDIKRKREKISREFPDFITKLTLLLNAGLVFENVIKKIVDENIENSIINSELKSCCMT